MLQWAREQGCPWNEKACLRAAIYGHVQVLQWLDANGAPWSDKYFCKASKFGRFEVLEWSVNTKHKGQWPHYGDKHSSTYSAVQYKRFDVLKWAVLEHHRAMTWWSCTEAAKRGRLDMLRFMYQHGCHCDSSAFVQAAIRNDMEMIQWLCEQKCPIDASICAAAAANGHLALLQWLRSKDFPWDERTCNAASTNIFPYSVGTRKWLSVGRRNLSACGRLETCRNYYMDQCQQSSTRTKL